jgi:hypothetical protein
MHLVIIIRARVRVEIRVRMAAVIWPTGRAATSVSGAGIKEIK